MKTSDTPLPRRFNRMALAQALVVLGCVHSCRPAQHAGVIGLGYRNQTRAADVARLVLDSTPEGESGLRIVTDAGTVRSFGAATEVDHATRLAALAGIAGVVGHGGSREALTTAPIYNERHIVQIVPTGTSRRLASAGPWTFTLAPNDSIEGEFLGNFVATRLGARTATVFYVLDEYGAGLRDGAVAALRAQGVRVLDEVPVPSSGECPPRARTNTYASAVDAAFLHGHPDVIVLATRQIESGCIVAQVREHDRRIPLVAGDGLLANADFTSRAGHGSDSVFIVAFWHPARADSVSHAFVRRYQRLFGAEPRHDEAMVYDALLALVAAVETVGTDHERVRDYLASLGHSRPALRGVTGLISFPGGRERLIMTRLRGDSLELVSAR